MVLIVLVIGGCFAEKYWPYRYRNVKPLLESVFASRVTISHYRRTYFPHPGFVAQELTLYRNSAPDLPPIGSMQDLIVQGSWLDLLTLHERVRLVDVVELHVVIPPVGSRANHEDFPAGSSADFGGPSSVVEELHIHKAVLDIMRTDGSRYSYVIHEAIIRNLRKGEPFSYSVDMHDSSPPGRLQAKGSFGPIPPKNLGATPLSGDFTFSPVDLGGIGELHGTLSSVGHFSGPLAGVKIHATAETPDFAVSDGRPIPVAGSLECTVNGLNGNIVLNDVAMRIGKTVVQAQGEIAGSPKSTDLDLNVTEGRAQDLLHPFLEGEVPITGVVWVKVHAHLDPDGHGVTFFHRLRADGSFSVPKERLTSDALEQKVSDFSQRARGSKQGKADSSASDADPDGAADVVSSLEGQVEIREGVASTRRLMFQIPGASANLHGSYDFKNWSVHMLGDLKTQTDISHTVTGFKSLLLKPLIPFFKKKKAGAVIPVAVTGERGHYKVSQNLLHEK